jgi:hypothetical protein
MFCNAYTKNGTANMDGYCANHWYTGNSVQPNQQPTPAYNWNSTPNTNLSGTFGGSGGNAQIQGLPNPNRVQQVNPLPKTCTPNGYGGYVCQ